MNNEQWATSSRLSLEPEGTEGKQRRANPEEESQRKQWKCDMRNSANKQQACLVHTSRRSNNEPWEWQWATANRFDHEDEANEGKRRRASPEDEAQRKQQKCDIRKQKQQARLVHTHRSRASSKSTAGGAKHRSQNAGPGAGAEHMKRAWHAEGSPRESDQGLTTPMPWPCSGCMQRKRQWGQDTARKRCCSNQINSYSLILCRALRRERCSVSASTACPSPSASARPQASAPPACGALIGCPAPLPRPGSRGWAPRVCVAATGSSDPCVEQRPSTSWRGPAKCTVAASCCR